MCPRPRFTSFRKPAGRIIRQQLTTHSEDCIFQWPTNFCVGKNGVAPLALTHRDGLYTVKEPYDAFALALGVLSGFEAIAVELAIMLADSLLAAAAKLLDALAGASTRKAWENDMDPHTLRQ